MKLFSLNQIALNQGHKDRVLISSPDKGIKSSHGTILVGLPVGGQTQIEKHSENEVHCAMKGRAHIDCNGENFIVEGGEVIAFEPFDVHLITNIGDEPFVFVTTFWNQMELLSEVVYAKNTGKLGHTVFIIPAYPTPNGDLHFGHLSGPFFASDILRRGLLNNGKNPHLFIGTIGHLSHIEIASQKLNKSYYQTAEDYSENIKKTLDMFGIISDTFIPPTPTLRYAELTRFLFEKLKERGFVREKTCSVLSTSSGKICVEAYVAGSCPYCLSECSGNDCEQCGRFHDERQMLNPREAQTGELLSVVEKSRFYFATEKVRRELELLFANAACSPQVLAFVSDIISQPLEDFPITQFQGYGVEIGLDHYKDQRFCINFENGIRYIYSFAESTQAYDSDMVSGEDLFNAAVKMLKEKEPQAAIFFGYDNAFQRLIMTPALLIAILDSKWLPSSFHMNHFMLLEGTKFSTSRCHAIWGKELVHEFPIDIVRIISVRLSPVLKDTDFAIGMAHDLYECEIYGKWGMWLIGLQYCVDKFSASKVPEPGDWDWCSRMFYGHLVQVAQTVEKLYVPEMFSLSQIAQSLRSLVESAIEYSESCTPWKGHVPQRYIRTHIALQLMAARIFAQILLPVAPNIGTRLFIGLGQTNRLSSIELGTWLVPDASVSGLSQAIPVPREFSTRKPVKRM